ncbi:acetyl-CoA carboxylase carboxyltransferase subunit alpha [Mucisphaera sp.]|uniref:acetyl-CoA carboxylase carboxyltransferase subunit alpha n=1 Tax=Mucisphaera sp. TaxID=2913024 RepID=UPI003D136A19
MAQAPSTNGLYELDFERPIIALERQIAELEAAGSGPDGSAGVDLSTEVRHVRQSHQAMLKKVYTKLSAWNTVKVARHPSRPQSVDYIQAFVKDYAEIHGDRRFGDDPAIMAGFGRIGQHKAMIIGHRKGKDTKEKVACHFGCAHPEGYRKALRAMTLAEKFHLPVVFLIDTPGAYPGIGAEERGQAQAIAENLREMARLRTPIVAVVIGEGASGGALGIGVADRIAMMQFSWYTVISPEGCAAILWKKANPETNAAAAEALKLTATDNVSLGTIDEVIEEPLGGAHRDPATAAVAVEAYLTQALRELKRFKIDNLMAKRYQRLRAVGEVATG